MADRLESVDDYLASLDDTKAQTLRTVIDLVLREFPELEVKRLTVAIASLSAEMHSTLRTNTYLTIGAIAAVGGLISATVSLA